MVRARLGLGDAAYTMNDRPAARAAWLEALALGNDSDPQQEEQIRRRLAELDRDVGGAAA
ncbi:hypothetical protein [Paractinoplanes hotanensis]|uniref:Tetratricopeptide repeat protein n=1 Tax=Paractinoplanes hotanensis TaxID=2906497 RepID=A0ABT0XXY7_9ACTN|nr:hypothetical protein [Actinoplanes hotanensis]MCM4077974.1 hypothetical protein [Actinoplanes hotanensis]